ncbi:anthrone oxygenase family protein [Siccirubricoccus phaeus]|uniref:anthrone oxygenase family protein n=1 Tax=Siccirubricoccus phaeus TaxID=2595053 RepID=UPI0011F193EA|nr:anthrone oxygenase family protein [Siccirubricoccus phaeus]
MALLHQILLGLGLLATALAAGLFYAFSIAVMPGLAAADPAAAIRAMQAINAEIRTPLFAFSFFGALALPVLAGVAGLADGARLPALLCFAGALAYGIGTFGVTLACNLPLNEMLAASEAPADPAAAAMAWRRYARPWTAWNHVRSLAATLAFGLMAAALAANWREAPP